MWTLSPIETALLIGLLLGAAALAIWAA